MIIFTPKAVSKILEVMAQQIRIPIALRLGVMGGGCSGFQYSMQWENEKQPSDKVWVYPDLSMGIGEEMKLVVLVDPISMMYLDGCEIDYLETLEESGFKFNNPNTTTSCGCGKSFSV